MGVFEPASAVEVKERRKSYNESLVMINEGCKHSFIKKYGEIFVGDVILFYSKKSPQKVICDVIRIGIPENPYYCNYYHIGRASEILFQPKIETIRLSRRLEKTDRFNRWNEGLVISNSELEYSWASIMNDITIDYNIIIDRHKTTFAKIHDNKNLTQMYNWRS